MKAMKHTRPNLCQKCFNKHLQAKGEEPLTNVQWRQVVEKKAYRGRMWKMMEKEPHLRGMSEYFSCERLKAKKFRQPADEKQSGIQGQWQLESPAREYWEQVKSCYDTYCNESMMKKSFTALKKKWNEGRISRNIQGKDESLGMAFDRIKEALDLVAQDEAKKGEHCARNHVQEH